MNHRLTCDEVFDQLTRAPFPSGEETDRCVDDHLRVCHECRQLAEALRPATDLFREVLSEDQRRHLPAYRGPLATMTGNPKVVASRGTSRTHLTAWNPLAAGSASWHPRWHVLPALGLAVLLMVALLDGRGWIGDATNLDSPVAQATVGSDRPMTCVLAGFALPPDCLPRSIVGPTRPHPSNVSAPTSGDANHLTACLRCHVSVQADASNVCCTHCHAASLEKLPGKTVFPRLATSCAQCHDDGQQESRARG